METGFFTNENGVKSSRRLNAFLLIVDGMLNLSGGVVAAILITIKAGSITFNWPLAAVILGAGLIPLVISTIIFYFTTWGDIEKIIKTVTKKGE